MTSVVGAGVAATSGGLRPFNPFRDLTAVTSLLARVFGAELRSDSLAGSRSLGWAARHPELSWLWLGFDAWFDGDLAGFVWLEGGRVVGNANVSPASGAGRHWVISNVAVEAPYRGRGIASALVRACCEHAECLGARRLLLQVWRNNRSALGLYERQGFHVIGHFERLEFGGAVPNAVPRVTPHDGPWRPVRSADLHDLGRIAAAVTSHEARLLRPSPAAAFQDDGWGWWRSVGARLGMWGARRCEVLLEDETLVGGLALKAHIEGRAKLAALLLPAAEQRWAAHMARRAAEWATSSPAVRVTCDLPGSLPRLAEAMHQAGFARADSLLQMSRELTR